MSINYLLNSYPSRVILNRLGRNSPKLARGIQTAQAAGYPADVILNRYAKHKAEEDEDYEPSKTEHEQTMSRDKRKKRKAALQALGALGTAGAVAATGIGIASHLANRNAAIRPSQILPPPPGFNPRNPRGPGPTVPGRGPTGNRTVAGLLGGPNQPNNPPTKPNAPTPNQPSPRSHSFAPNPNGPQTMTLNEWAQQNAAPAPAQQQQQRSPQTVTKNATLVRNLREDKRFDQILSSVPNVATAIQTLKKTIPPGKLSILEKAQGGLEQVLQDYAEANAPAQQQQTPQPEASVPDQMMAQQEEQAAQVDPALRNAQPQEIQSKKTGVDIPFRDLEIRLRDLRKAEEDLKEGRPSITPNEPVEVSINIDTGKKTLEDGYHRYLAARGGIIDKNNFDKNADQNIKAEIKYIKNDKMGSFSIEREASEEEIKDYLEGKHPKTSISVEIPEIKEIINNFVMTPLGAGEVKHKGKAGQIVSTPSGDKSFPDEDIEDVPQDVIQAVSNILQIPEVDRSSNIALFLYNPKDKEMYFQFHDGSAYKYYDIDPDKVYRLANKMAIPITSGENIYGAWSPEDKASLGAAFYQEILKDPKYKKPGKGEPPNPFYHKLETMYDYWKDLRKKPKVRKTKEDKPIKPKKSKKKDV